MPKEQQIEVVARGAMFRGSTVLLCRAIRHGYLYLPGGHVEFDEPARAAVEREFKEECGLTVRAGDLLLVSEAAFESGKRRHHEINLVFHVEHEGGPPERVVSNEPEIAFEWADLAGIADLDVRPMAVKAWLMSGPRQGAEFASEV